MIKHGIENINFNNPLENKLPKVIDYFVKFYGEKYRARITERLNNATYIFTETVGSLNSYYYLKDYFENKNEEVAAQFFKNIGCEHQPFLYMFLDWKNWQNSVKNYGSTSIPLNKNLSTLLASYLKLDDCSQQDKDELIHLFLLDKKNNIKIQKYLAKSEALFNKIYKPQFEYLQKEYARISPPFKENFDKLSKIRKNFSEKRLILLKNHISQTFDIDFNKPELNEIAEILELFLSKGRFEFNKEKSLKLFQFVTKQNDNKTSFDEFINDKNLLSKIRNEAVIKEFSTLVKEEKEAILSNNAEYIHLKEILENDDIYQGDILATLGDYITKAGNVMAYIDHTFKYSSPYEPYAICVLPATFCLDNETLVHELNHIIESDIIYNTQFEMTMRCGICPSVLNKNFNTTYGSREFNMLNEVINDYIAIKINKLMAKDGFTIGLHKHIKSVFAYAFPLLSEFIEDNWDALIDCRMGDAALEERFDMNEIASLARVTTEFLLINDKDNILKEIESKTFKGVNIFDILDNDELELSNDAKNYVNCYRQVSYSTNKLKLTKIKLSKTNPTSNKTNPASSKTSSTIKAEIPQGLNNAKRKTVSQVLEERRRERENASDYSKY